uniref:Uncharacterized protein n=1 Tax=Wuchereria bancrofti TaxID=6293 RepID=A0AAF5PW93_WUCBA
MGSSYEAIGPAENIALPPEEKKVENNGRNLIVEQKAEKVADRKETHSDYSFMFVLISENCSTTSEYLTRWEKNED